MKYVSIDDSRVQAMFREIDDILKRFSEQCSELPGRAPRFYAQAIECVAWQFDIDRVSLQIGLALPEEFAASTLGKFERMTIVADIADMVMGYRDAYKDDPDFNPKI